ncbi:MAG: PEP-CTERM sorting domain-containing protein [Rhizobacter sp.]
MAHASICTRTAISIALAAAFCTAHAAVIDFDDLQVGNYPSSMWEPYVDPIAPQAYARQGVVIEGGWLWPADHPWSQSMRVSPDTRITFIGASLPTRVSLHLRWLPEDVLDLRAVGPSGYTSTFHSFGYGDGPSVPPDFGNQIISFQSAAGISSLSFADSSFMRFPAWVDDLSLGNNVPAVPEPGPLLLAGAGLLLLGARHRRSATRP